MKPRTKITLVPLIAATYFMVAGGPYGLEDIVAKAGYTTAIAILVVTPLIWSLPTALMVSELASALPQEGGFYVWVTRAMGRFWGFQEAWLSLVGSIFDMAIYPTLFVGYLGHFAPDLVSGGNGIWIGVALIAVCVAWNLLGARAVGGSSVMLGILLLSPFVALTGYALLARSVPGASSVPLQNGDLLGGILVAMWNFMGWDNASTIAGEVDQPQRTYPRAMIGALILVTLTYILPIAAVALTGLSPNRWSTGGWAEVARAVFSNGGAIGGGWMAAGVALAITVGGMVGAAGTLNALTMSFSQLPAVMAKDGFLPKVFARRHPRTGAPWVAVIACATAWALCLRFDFVKLIVLDVLLTGLSILLEFVALVVLRIREPGLWRPYRVPGGLAGAIALGVAPLALLLLTVVRNHEEAMGPISALQLAGMLIAAGGLAYVVSERLRPKSSSSTSAVPRS
jgi:amino acid transporter